MLWVYLRAFFYLDYCYLSFGLYKRISGSKFMICLKKGEMVMSQSIKSWLQQSFIGLCAFLLLGFGWVEGKQLSPALTQALQQAQTEGATRPSVQPRNIGAPAIAAEADEFVQTEAHLQVGEVKEKLSHIDLYYEGGKKDPRSSNELVTPYLNIIAAAINKEEELKNSHYAFYNGTGTEWRVTQDLYKQLYAYRNPSKVITDFTFVRFSDVPSMHAQDFLRENVAEWAGVNDNIQEVRDVLISTNLSLFGGVGTQGECTWNYFLTAKSHRYPTALHFHQVLEAFDMSYDIELLAKEAQTLAEMISDATKEQMLLQIFIPQNKVDDTAYLSWILGVPYYPKSVALMEKRIGRQERTGAVTGPAVKEVMKKMRKDPAYKALHEELKEAVENGDFGIRAFMDEYRNVPWSIKNVNDIQARILVTKDIVLNPDSGVKIFRYFTTPRDIQEAYLRKLDALVKKIIAQENSKTPQQKVADQARNEKIYTKLHQEEIAAREAEKVSKKAAKKK